MYDIDLVIPWVDGSDPIWLEERNKYAKHKNLNPGYYQDWGWMRYWFRCVEENLPWIRNVFFVTYGHIPPWLNLNNPKLKIVNHKDYIPAEFLPTFGGEAYSLNLHRIDGLSETFIYAEDDMFFIGRQEPDDFFSEDGMPKDYIWMMPMMEQFHGDFAHIMLNDMLIIRKHFGMQSILSKSKDLLYSDQYPEEAIADNRRYRDLKYIPGFKEPHLALSFRKSTFEKIWEEEAFELYKCCMYKFRTLTAVCAVLIRDWQLASGNFSPYYQSGRYFTDTADPRLRERILSEDTKMICINESEKQGYSISRSNEICSYFELRFPKRSSFELE